MIGLLLFLAGPPIAIAAAYLLGRDHGRAAARELIEIDGDLIFQDGMMHGIRIQRERQRRADFPRDLDDLDARDSADWWKGDAA